MLVARSAGRLEELAGELRTGRAAPCGCWRRTSPTPKSPEEVFRELEAAGVAVDVLVNNAGFATFGPFAEIDLGKELEELQLNVVTLTHLTKKFLPGMLARRRGGVLNVASTAGFQPGPLMAVYYATKAYVLSFSEALAEELAGTGVTVTALCPGPTADRLPEPGRHGGFQALLGAPPGGRTRPRSPARATKGSGRASGSSSPA